MTDFKPFDSANKVLITGAAGFIDSIWPSACWPWGPPSLAWITLTIIMMFP